ncbi:hypothetical protein [Lacisediminihabitans sp.]|jgi:hypothetical protein|uniref:hypothetical protein n=1 Tax=Lacisediminihabitans sp. TaxID=2787631 RepID=UPI002F938BD7
MNRKRTPRGAVTVVALASVIALTLSGCVFIHRGQSEHDASKHIKSIPGLASGEVFVSNSYDGFQKVTGTAALITVKPNYTVKDPAALVDYLIRVAWSANQSKPTEDILVTVESSSSFDSVTAAKSAGWSSAYSLPNDPTAVSIDLSELKKRLGDWPGKVPAPSSAVAAAIVSAPSQ